MRQEYSNKNLTSFISTCTTVQQCVSCTKGVVISIPKNEGNNDFV